VSLLVIGEEVFRTDSHTVRLLHDDRVSKESRNDSGPAPPANAWQALGSSPVKELKRRGYEVVVNIRAEFSDPEAKDRLIVEDLAFAKSLFGDA
jgi:hypothetical protein